MIRNKRHERLTAEQWAEVRAILDATQNKPNAGRDAINRQAGGEQKEGKAISPDNVKDSQDKSKEKQYNK